MVLGDNILGSDVLASPKDDEERQIWALLCKASTDWSAISREESTIERCDNAD